MAPCLPRSSGCGIAVHSLWQKSRSWGSGQCCSFHTMESKEDVWPNRMGYPRLLEQSGLKTINPVTVLQFKKKVYKSAPCLTLETLNAQPHAGTNTSYRSDTDFCLILLHFQSIGVISLPWRQKLLFYWHQSMWLCAAVFEREGSCCCIFLLPVCFKERTNLLLEGAI